MTEKAPVQSKTADNQTSSKVKQAHESVSLTGFETVIDSPQLASAQQMIQLQRLYGNQAVSKMVADSKARVLNAKPPEFEPTTTSQADMTIQRLPSRADVESDIGKAGFYILNPTSWEKFLKSLDDFSKAEANGDKEAQLENVINLQKYTNEWMDSDKRNTKNKKKQAKDDKKREFLNQLRPDLKILYYELDTKAKTVDVAKDNAAENADENIQQIREKLLLNEIDDSVETIQAMLARLQAAKLTTNFDANVLNFLIASPDFKSIWQLAYKDNTPSGILPAEYDKLKGFEKREAAERWLGYDPFAESQRDNRPAYLAVNVLNNPKGAAPSYGRFFFEYKESVKQRATFTPFDQFEMISKSHLKDFPEKTIGSADNMEALLAYNDGVLKVLGNLVNDIEMTELEVKTAMGKYLEAQVHGGVSVDDVDTLVVDYPESEDDRDEFNKGDAAIAERFIAKYPGIKLRYR